MTRSNISRPLLAGALLSLGAACSPPHASPRPQPRVEPPRPSEPDEEDGPITETERRSVVEALSAALEQKYVFADKAKAIGLALRGHVERGDYAKLATAQPFARRLTEDMAALVHDKHLEVRYFEHPVAPGAGEHPPGEDEEAQMLYLNQGVFDVRRMKFNIGYVELHVFGRPSAFAEKLAAAMRLVHDTQSLIVDLRECHGGDTESVTLATSYFVPAGTHLLDMYTRATDQTERVVAVEALAGPRYGADHPLFILIGEETGSGCEAFAFTLQAQKRATVIGAHSAGAAYFGDPVRLTDHFMAFVPVGRPIEPITHGDWEGHGVTPQIEVPPARALEVAEREVLARLLPREPSKHRQRDMQKRLGELRRSRLTGSGARGDGGRMSDGSQRAERLTLGAPIGAIGRPIPMLPPVCSPPYDGPAAEPSSFAPLLPFVVDRRHRARRERDARLRRRRGPGLPDGRLHAARQHGREVEVQPLPGARLR